MHEKRLVADLIRKASEVAADHHTDHLAVVTVRVGALSHVAAGSIAAQIRDGATGTPVENARIDVVIGAGGAAAIADEHAEDVILQSVELGGN
jgi:Zn finger protein HypA/HybF involved in hydrogenase expression